MAVSVEKKVGLFFLVTVVALGLLIEVVEDWSPFQKQIDYHTFFRSAVGLKAGDPVRMAGVDVGKVRRIALDDGQARVDFYVVEGTSIPSQVVAQIRRTNLLGGQFLGLETSDVAAGEWAPETPLPSEEGTNIDQLITNFDRNQDRVLKEIGDLVAEVRAPLTQTIMQLERVMHKVDQGEGTLGRLINDPVLYDDLTASVSDLKAIFGRLENGEGSLGKLLQDPALYEEARLTFANLQAISSRLQAGEGSLGRLLTDDALYTEATDTMAQLREVASKVNEGEGTLGRLINDGSLYEEMRGTMVRVNSIAAKIDDGQGTLGRLVNEDDLYREAKTTLHKVEKTVDGMSDSGPLSALGVILGTLF
ncbi:MAG: MCE family protein [Desulfuromonadales bacterium]|nr:MCE family protein [Desulfuromonadales bacterium]